MVKENEGHTQVNLRIKDSEQFYSNEASINFNPNEFVIDFKCLTHLHDLGDHRSVFLRHNIVLINPFHAKAFLVMLDKAIKQYEQNFGEIKKPDAIKKAEKLVKKQKDKEDPVPIGENTYFG